MCNSYFLILNITSMNRHVRKGRWRVRIFALGLIAILLITAYGVRAQTGTTTITGKVTGEGNAPMPGVSVQVKGTTRGVTTDAQGDFSIQAAAKDILVFTYVGYATQEMPVGSQTSINVTLSTTGHELQQVVVVG